MSGQTREAAGAVAAGQEGRLIPRARIRLRTDRSFAN